MMTAQAKLVLYRVNFILGSYSTSQSPNSIPGYQFSAASTTNYATPYYTSQVSDFFYFGTTNVIAGVATPFVSNSVGFIASL